MKKLRTLLLTAAILLSSAAAAQTDIYGFTVKDMEGQDVSLSKYKGKVLLIVNTATECGFTPQYKELQEMYEQYMEQAFDILDFPCNQFGGQAPGTDKDIHAFCTGRYGIQFEQMAKIDVNGADAAPLYQYLIKSAPFSGFDTSTRMGKLLHLMMKKKDADYEKNPDIKWNFTKFLVDKEGHVVKRFEPTVDMAEVNEEVRLLIEQ
ncbi:MAG: glutathione peroxidase [Bacteroidales bacterium]|nr:glutathione peroxidase [Bacteroidales bacterium]